MKLEITREWFERKVKLEGDLEISAGARAIDPAPELSLNPKTETETKEVARIAFGSLIEFRRRELGLTMERLAEQMSLDLDIIFSIERDAHFRPKRETVKQIAQNLDLPDKALMQLAGHSAVKSSRVLESVLRFAAQSADAVQTLSDEQQQALDDFVASLRKN